MLLLSTDLRLFRKSPLQKKKPGMNSYILGQEVCIAQLPFFLFFFPPLFFPFLLWGLGFCEVLLFLFCSIVFFSLGLKPVQAWQSLELKATQVSSLPRWKQVSMFHGFAKHWHVLTQLQQTSSSYIQTTGCLALERWSQTLHSPKQQNIVITANC